MNHKNMEYKLSHYNICKSEDDKAIVFNALSGALVFLDDFEYNKLLSFRDMDVEDALIVEWMRLGIIVDASSNETEVVNYCRFRDTFTKNTAVYRILTTTCCNARCFYCYEENYERKTMDIDTAKAASRFIVNNSKNLNSITLNWFGGEPLLNPDVISLITHNVLEGLNDSKTKINASLITNASLFSDELIEIAKTQWHISNVQITFDGSKEEHERRKNYINFPNSFEQTLDVVRKLLSKEINVSIRLNYDKNNVEDIVTLIPFIRKRFGENTHLHCYAYPLFNREDNPIDTLIKKDEVANFDSIVTRSLMESGFYNPQHVLKLRRTTGCFAVLPNSFVINANGDLYKCSMNMKDESKSVGNVYQQVDLSKQFVEWCNPVLQEKCNVCVALPLCQGGCRAAQKANTDENYCNLKLNTLDFALSSLLDKNEKIKTDSYENN